MDEMIAWLVTRMDDEERVAQAAGGDAWAEDGNSVTSAALAQGDFSERGYWVASASFACEGETESLREGHAEHIARHDPARVLRKLRADRAIVDWCLEVIGDRDLRRYGEPGLLKDDPDALAVTLAVETIRNLAAGMSDQPGYRDEWRP